MVGRLGRFGHMSKKHVGDNDVKFTQEYDNEFLRGTFI
jgi:hypothetical protein